MSIVRIRLRKPRRVLDFLCGDKVLQRDDVCIVESEHGLEWGVCVLPPEPVAPEISERVTMRVLRKATDADLEGMKKIEAEEVRAADLCRKRIVKRNLPMLLVDVECTYDRHKITFYFTAENRVDFRELVRDLARELHSRIELRHIQVRDRSKLVGGLGSCGRTLCCATWMEEFMPISMRMAKCQNLSLNPSKISGQCGRLLCCLSYENEGYERGAVSKAALPAMENEEYDESRVKEMEDVPYPDFVTVSGQGQVVSGNQKTPSPPPSSTSSDTTKKPRSRRKKKRKGKQEAP